MATSAVFASTAAEAGFVPASYSTFAFGSFARITFSGEVGNHIWSCQCVWPLPGGMIAFPPGGSTWRKRNHASGQGPDALAGPDMVSYFPTEGNPRETPEREG